MTRDIVTAPSRMTALGGVIILVMTRTGDARVVT
jgi:hypothetical protein